PEAEGAVEEEEAFDFARLAVAVVEERDGHVERGGDLLKTSSADAVHALLVPGSRGAGIHRTSRRNAYRRFVADVLFRLSLRADGGAPRHPDRSRQPRSDPCR